MNKVRTTTIVTAWLAMGAACTDTESGGMVDGTTPTPYTTPPGTPASETGDTAQWTGTEPPEETGDTGQ